VTAQRGRHLILSDCPAQTRSMPELRRVVIDVLKPHDPPLLAFSERVASTDSVDAVTTTLIELDTEVQNVRITVTGEPLDYDAVQATIDRLGGSVHSVDQASYGDTVVEDPHQSGDG